MTKPDSEVIEKFNEYVNMTADDLEEWLKSDPSTSSGWNKEDGSGETVGHDSGRKIVEILKDNPDKDPSKYTSDHLSHMHKVVAYCARHLAQEAHMKDEKSPEELRETKSYKSLKNWGHDSLKKDGQASGGKKKEQDDGEEEEKAAPSKGKGKGKASKEEVEEDEKREEASKADADQGSDEEGGIVSGKRKRKERDIQVQEDPEYNSEEDDDFAPGDDDDEEEGEGDDSDDDEDDDDEEEDEDDDEPAKKKAKND